MNLTLKEAASELPSNEAEQVLESVGFSADHLHDRIPQRFLHPSKLKGIDFDFQSILGKTEDTVDTNLTLVTLCVSPFLL